MHRHYNTSHSSRAVNCECHSTATVDQAARSRHIKLCMGRSHLLLLPNTVTFTCTQSHPIFVLYNLIQGMLPPWDRHCGHAHNSKLPHHEAQEASHHLSDLCNLGCGGARAVRAPVLDGPDTSQSHGCQEAKSEGGIASDALYGIGYWNTLQHACKHFTIIMTTTNVWDAYMGTVSPNPMTPYPFTSVGFRVQQHHSKQELAENRRHDA